MESIGAENSGSEKTKSEKNKLEKISIVSCNICYGQMPGQTDEVEQHLLRVHWRYDVEGLLRVLEGGSTE